MSQLTEDPRLTAYALDECSDAERTEIEALLAHDAEARAEVAAIQHAAHALKAELAQEPAPALDAARRQAIDAATLPESGRHWGAGMAGLAAAAAIVVGICLSNDDQTSERQAAPSSAAERQRLISALNGAARQGAVMRHAPNAPVEVPNESRPLPESKPVSLAQPQMADVVSEMEAEGSLRAPPSAPTLAAAPVWAFNGGADGTPYRDDILPAARPSGETYDHVPESGFFRSLDKPLSTFSIDVDTASYANVRRFINSGQWPPADAVRVEELINYFTYHDLPPTDGKPFAAHVEVSACPWNMAHQLARIGVRAKDVAIDRRPASNLVFLVDVSGSMEEADKLPLVKSSLAMLVEQLGENDHVAMAVYAGSSGLVLPPTDGSRKRDILAAIDRLEAGGSTNGGAGIQLAYDTARQNFKKGGTNRVILATDGDFNVGITDRSALISLIEQEARSGVFLSVLGFGTGNLQDSQMEQLADKGNGNYSYIDSLAEGRKVLVEQMSGTLLTVAKDVKIQIEFNPAWISDYRLIGYENRILTKEDFNNDRKDAGEIGAAHCVTALYELIPAEMEGIPAVDPLKYQRQEPAGTPLNTELMTIKLRYKEPAGETSTLLQFPVSLREIKETGSTSNDFRFAAAVAGFGMILRHSPQCGSFSLNDVFALGATAIGDDQGYRKEFIDLVQAAMRLNADPSYPMPIQR